jgi:hypothetical protein
MFDISLRSIGKMEQWRDGIMGYCRNYIDIVPSSQHSTIPKFQYSTEVAHINQ